MSLRFYVVTASAGLDGDDTVFPAYDSFPLPSSSALPWQADVTGRQPTVLQDDATTLTANDDNHPITGSMEDILSASFNLPASEASSSSQVPAALPMEMNYLHELSSNDTEYFSLADTEADFFHDFFHNLLCDL